METKPHVAIFKSLQLQVPTNKLGFTKGQLFEFGLGSRIVHELGSFGEGSKNPTTPRLVEEVAAKVMQANKISKLFQTIAIVNLNMGNLNLDVNIREREGSIGGGIGQGEGLPKGITRYKNLEEK